MKKENRVKFERLNFNSGYTALKLAPLRLCALPCLARLVFTDNQMLLDMRGNSVVIVRGLWPLLFFTATHM